MGVLCRRKPFCLIQVPGIQITGTGLAEDERRIERQRSRGVVGQCRKFYGRAWSLPSVTYGIEVTVDEIRCERWSARRDRSDRTAGARWGGAQT